MKSLQLSFDSVKIIDQSDERGPTSERADALYCNVLAVCLSAAHGTVPATVVTARTVGDVMTNIGPGRTGDMLSVSRDTGTISLDIDETDTLAVMFVVLLWNHRGFSNDQTRFVYEELSTALGAELNSRSLVELMQLSNAERRQAFSDAIKGRIQGPALMNALKTLNLGALTPDQNLGSVAKVFSAGDLLSAGTTHWEETITFGDSDSAGRNGAGSYRLKGSTVVA